MTTIQRLQAAIREMERKAGSGISMCHRQGKTAVYLADDGTSIVEHEEMIVRGRLHLPDCEIRVERFGGGEVQADQPALAEPGLADDKSVRCDIGQPQGHGFAPPDPCRGDQTQHVKGDAGVADDALSQTTRDKDDARIVPCPALGLRPDERCAVADGDPRDVGTDVRHLTHGASERPSPAACVRHHSRFASERNFAAEPDEPRFLTTFTSGGLRRSHRRTSSGRYSAEPDNDIECSTG